MKRFFAALFLSSLLIAPFAFAGKGGGSSGGGGGGSGGGGGGGPIGSGRISR